MNPIKYYSDLIGIEKYEFYIGVYGKNDCLRFFIYIGLLIKVFKYKNYIIFMIFILSVSKYNDSKDINKH